MGLSQRFILSTVFNFKLAYISELCYNLGRKAMKNRTKPPQVRFAILLGDKPALSRLGRQGALERRRRSLENKKRKTESLLEGAEEMMVQANEDICPLNED
jgi:hypothetical protein